MRAARFVVSPLFVAFVSILTAGALYLSISGLIENSRTDDDVQRIAERLIVFERPTPAQRADAIDRAIERLTPKQAARIVAKAGKAPRCPSSLRPLDELKPPGAS